MKSIHQWRGANHQRGSVSIIIAFMLIVIIGFAGLAIDTGRHYGIKAKLSAASDAAAIAGARALQTGNSQAERIANAETAVQRYFDLNYPANFKRSTTVDPTAVVLPLGNGRWEVTVNAQASNPNFFMGILGHGDTGIRSVSQAIRVNPDLMMVLDSSGSIGAKMPILKQAAKNGFVSKFIPDPDGDRLGVVNFATGSVIAEAINKTAARGFDRNNVNAAIDSLTANGWTATSDAMRKAREELNAVPVGVRSALRVMLVFSDGAPNVLAAQVGTRKANVDQYGAYYDPDSLSESGMNLGLPAIPAYAVGGVPTVGRLTFSQSVTQCNIVKATRNLTENIAKMARQDGIVIYAIGLGDTLLHIENPGPSCGLGDDDRGINLMRRLANTDDNNPDYIANQPRGLFCHALTTSDLEPCFEKIANDILRLTM
ncbi:MAG: vWA domain-containing protein [Burkholderiaceae bacterium]